MKTLFTILTLLFFSSFLKAQRNSCIDSITFNKFNPTFFQYFKETINTVAQRDSADNIFLGGAYGISPLASAMWYSSIIKFNKDNNLVSSKWYRPATVNSNFQNFGQLVAIDDKADLYFTGSTHPAVTSKPTITKMDSTGNFIWIKQINSSSNNYLFGNMFELPVLNVGNLFFYNYAGDIAAFSTMGNVFWAKNFSFINPPAGFTNTGVKICALPNNNLLVCNTGFTSPDGSANHPAALHFVHFAKINGNTGKVIQQQTLRCFITAGSQMLKFYPNNLNYDDATSTVLLVGVSYFTNSPGGAITKQVYCKLDSNLIPLKTAYINSSAVFASSFSNNENYISVNKKSETSFVFQEYRSGVFELNKLSYITVDNNLQITAQRKIDYSPFAFPWAAAKTTIGFKKDGTLNFQSGSFTGVNFPMTLLVYDHIPFYNTLSPCLGYDTTFFYNSPAYSQIIPTLNYQDTGTISATVTDIIPDGIMQNFAMPQQQICKQVSICDTIKILGNNFHCLSSPMDSFKLVRNPLCKRITSWQVDSSAIKILSQTDTSLYVEYLKAYTGFIKVNFAGCTLTDSLPITVYSPPANGLNLGNDITTCPGTAVTLHAGNSFKTYLWQDGTTTESYTTMQPGKYYVTAVDSCGRIYADTVLLNTVVPVIPKLGNDTMHCPGKTITLHAGNGYNSYQWQNGTATESFIVTQPGKYYVTVKDSCNRILSDTILVKPLDAGLVINYPQELCSWDTAKINLPAIFTNYTWQPASYASLSINNQWALYPGVTTVYSISAEYPKGCILQDTVLIKTKICPDYIFFPNAFTPNGDGINDTYKPLIGGRVIRYEFAIYNRYGQIVFKTGNTKTAWNGNFNGSSKPTAGSFVWVCKYQFFNQPLIQKKGMFTLLR